VVIITDVMGTEMVKGACKKLMGRFFSKRNVIYLLRMTPSLHPSTRNQSEKIRGRV
jgi:hypothetical protein